MVVCGDRDVYTVPLREPVGCSYVAEMLGGHLLWAVLYAGFGSSWALAEVPEDAAVPGRGWYPADRADRAVGHRSCGALAGCYEAYASPPHRLLFAGTVGVVRDAEQWLELETLRALKQAARAAEPPEQPEPR